MRAGYSALATLSSAPGTISDYGAATISTIWMRLPQLSSKIAILTGPAVIGALAELSLSQR